MLSPSVWMGQINFQGDVIVIRQMIVASWGKPEVPYSGKFLWTTNFAVLVDFAATSKINPQKSFYSIQMQ